MYSITINGLKQKLKPGDILIGQYYITALSVTNIMLVNDSGKIEDKDLNNSNRYIENLENGQYMEYLIIKV